MAVNPDWVEILERVSAVVLPLLTFILGKATKGGANQLLLDTMCIDMKEVKLAQATQALTIASHTTLHAGYEQSNARMMDQLMENNRQLGELIGLAKAMGWRKPNDHT